MAYASNYLKTEYIQVEHISAKKMTIKFSKALLVVNNRIILLLVDCRTWMEKKVLQREVVT